MLQQEFREFLIRAKTSTYAAGDGAIKTKESDNSTTLVYIEGDWKYHDNYFGGEPYGGREVVFFRGKPLWMMTYYGWVESSVEKVGEVYSILQGALRNISLSAPYRGPGEYRKGSYIYKNSYNGVIENFSGEESIESDGIEVYRAKYTGGLVDQ